MASNACPRPQPCLGPGSSLSHQPPAQLSSASPRAHPYRVHDLQRGVPLPPPIQHVGFARAAADALHLGTPHALQGQAGRQAGRQGRQVVCSSHKQSCGSRSAGRVACTRKRAVRVSQAQQAGWKLPRRRVQRQRRHCSALGRQACLVACQVANQDLALGLLSCRRRRLLVCRFCTGSASRRGMECQQSAA